MSKNEVTFILVQSLKGGAGKSTIALSIAITLDVMKKVKEIETKRDDSKSNQSIKFNEDEEGVATVLNSSAPKPYEYKNDRNNICYIDIDILGTAMEDVIYKAEDNPYNRKLNEIISFDPSIDKTDNYKNKFEASVELNINGKTQIVGVNFDILLSSKESRLKKKFIIDNEYAAEIESKVFNHYFAIFMDKLLKSNYDYVVIDMSPGFDSIVKGVFDYCCRYKNKKKMINLIITTKDVAHVEANINFLKDFMLNDFTMYDEKFGSTYLVVNDIFNNKDNTTKDIEEYAKESFKDIKNFNKVYKGCVEKGQELKIVHMNLFRSKHESLDRLYKNNDLGCFFDSEFVKKVGLAQDENERMKMNEKKKKS